MVRYTMGTRQREELSLRVLNERATTDELMDEAR